MNADRISVNWFRNEGLRGRIGDNHGEGECAWCMTHGTGGASRTVPEGFPKKWWTGITQRRQEIFMWPQSCGTKKLNLSIN